MEKNEIKEILLRDLLPRIQYGVKALCKMRYEGNIFDKIFTIDCINVTDPYPFWTHDKKLSPYRLNGRGFFASEIQPYLRQLDDMTDEELMYFLGIRGKNPNKQELDKYRNRDMAIITTLSSYSHHIDWLNKNMFDYRGLIKKGLAIKVTEDNNPYKDKKD